MYDILVESWFGNLCGLFVGFLERVLVGRERSVGVEKGNCFRFREVGKGGILLECDGRSFIFSKEEFFEGDLLFLLDLVLVGIRKINRKCKVYLEGGEGVGGFLWFG